jgi:hypothetical protein
MLVKPFVGGLLLYLGLRRYGRPVLGATVGLAASAVLTILVFGWAPFASYLRPAHYGHLPQWIYTEPSNQSLLGTLLRWWPSTMPESGSPMAHPLFVALALVFTGTTAWLAFRHGATRDSWAAASVLLLSLLIYPASQMFYCVLLLVPFLLLWSERRLLPGGAVTAALGTGILYAAMDYRGGKLVFFATFLLWLASLVFMRLRPTAGTEVPA